MTTRLGGQIEVDRVALLADEHRAREQVPGAVAHFDGVEHRVGAPLVRAQLAEGHLRAEEAEHNPRESREDPRHSRRVMHEAPPPKNIVLFQGPPARSRNGLVRGLAQPPTDRLLLRFTRSSQ